MIYVLALALFLTALGLIRRMRVSSLGSVLLDGIVAAVLGWVSGVFIGVGARVGMWAIPFFNGTESRFSIDGSIQVVLIFSLIGIGLGVIYEFLFRDVLAHRGWLFGLIVTAVAWYPLALAGLQQVSFDPPILGTIGATGLIVGLMFVPFSIILEICVAKAHTVYHDHSASEPGNG